MPKWQYTRTETIEVEVPATVFNEESFLNWLADHLDPESGTRTVVDTFIGEAHEIKERSDEARAACLKEQAPSACSPARLDYFEEEEP